MNDQIVNKLVTAHEIVKSETFVEGVTKSLMPYGDYIQAGIACLLAGMGVGFLTFSIIHYYKYTGKSVHTKKTKRKMFGKYNLHLLKRGKRFKIVFSGSPKQHSNLIFRE
ncbi:MAG: hypothetical protein KGD64_02110 [Candidatus Heimdallarchaeota archaeon]|nr:hypothetical protein [Candidatus Heimdallarchaeota archaeon]